MKITYEKLLNANAILTHMANIKPSESGKYTIQMAENLLEIEPKLELCRKWISDLQNEHIKKDKEGKFVIIPNTNQYKVIDMVEYNKAYSDIFLQETEINIKPFPKAEKLSIMQAFNLSLAALKAIDFMFVEEEKKE